MLDVLDYTSPLGLLGKLADIIFLESYMTHLLTDGDRVIKQYAESGQWKNVVRVEKVVRG